MQRYLSSPGRTLPLGGRDARRAAHGHTTAIRRENRLGRKAGLAATGVLTALFSAGPTPDRVRDALPSLALVAGAVALRSAVQAGAGWAQARLEPQVRRLAELRLYEATTAVHLAALDDSDFLDDLQRAQTRGMTSAPRVVRQAVDVLTGVVGMVAAAGTLGVLHPLLLP